jgi:hypothetical protein
MNKGAYGIEQKINLPLYLLVRRLAIKCWSKTQHFRDYKSLFKINQIHTFLLVLSWLDNWPMNTLTQTEAQLFTERFLLVLETAAPKLKTAREVAIQFNLRHKGKPVSDTAVHYWMTGQFMPSEPHLLTLAAWFNVSVHWLRTGYESPDELPQFSPTQSMLFNRISTLSEDEQQAMIQLIDLIIRAKASHQ